MAQPVREPGDSPVRPPRDGNDDVSRDGAALRIEQTRNRARGVTPSCAARRGGCVRDGQRAGGPLYFNAVISCAGTARRYTPSGQRRAALSSVLALRRPGAAARAWRQANLAREAARKAKVAA